jgi:GDP-L-fucose synthase
VKPGDRVFIAGHRGLVGSALRRRLEAEGFEELILRARDELDLTDPHAVRAFFEQERPEYVFVAAAKVGGILANETYPADFIRDNLAIAGALIEAAHRARVRRLLFLGSSCIYPKQAPQPLKEEYLLTGPLEPTNEWYAVAKIAGVKLCQAHRRQHGDDFFSVLPTNLYGPGDNFDLRTSHVLPALIRKMHEAKAAAAEDVVVWGSGSPLREFMHVDDFADACVHLMRRQLDTDLINVGVGRDLTIAELADLIRSIVGFEGRIVYDRSKPDGTPRKLLDVSRLARTGWSPRIDLREGIASTYRWYAERASAASARAGAWDAVRGSAV